MRGKNRRRQKEKPRGRKLQGARAGGTPTSLSRMSAILARAPFNSKPLQRPKEVRTLVGGPQCQLMEIRLLLVLQGIVTVQGTLSICTIVLITAQEKIPMYPFLLQTLCLFGEPMLQSQRLLRSKKV